MYRQRFQGRTGALVYSTRPNCLSLPTSAHEMTLPQKANSCRSCAGGDQHDAFSE